MTTGIFVCILFFMTEEEFRNVLTETGLTINKDTADYLEVQLATTYGKYYPFVIFHKHSTGWGAGQRPAGNVNVYPIAPVNSIDGYVLDFETYDILSGKDREFSKPHKLKRFLNEQVQYLKELKCKIKETELSWDFCDEDPTV